MLLARSTCFSEVCRARLMRLMSFRRSAAVAWLGIVRVFMNVFSQVGYARLVQKTSVSEDFLGSLAMTHAEGAWTWVFPMNRAVPRPAPT